MNVHQGDLPEFKEFSVAAVRLLQGVVYSDDTKVWDALLANQSELTDYCARIGLMLIVDEPDGMAYLRQLTDDEREGGYESLPKLFRRTSLGYDATVLSVLLRDELRRFEDEDLDNERCVVEIDALLDAMKTFFPADEDEVRLRKRLSASLSKLEKLKFVKRFDRSGNTWEIRRIIKARLPIEALQRLRDQLVAATREGSTESASNSNDVETDDNGE